MSTIIVTKLDAARRQLHTAIDLWASEGDPVSIHALAYAAHQIIHDLNRKAKGPHLFLDMPGIKKEKRDEFVFMVKRDANFFKHADKRGKREDPPHIEFTPELNELFMLIAVMGLTYLKHQLTEYENGFVLWYRVHHPDMLDEAPGHDVQGTVDVNTWRAYKQLPKREFLEVFKSISTQGI